jgi:hypothetical protein
LLLDGVVSAAADWDKAEAARKPDFLAHRGSRLGDAQALAARRGPDWEPAIAPARAYLAAWQAREAAGCLNQHIVAGLGKVTAMPIPALTRIWQHATFARHR